MSIIRDLMVGLNKNQLRWVGRVKSQSRQITEKNRLESFNVCCCPISSYKDKYQREGAIPYCPITNRDIDGNTERSPILSNYKDKYRWEGGVDGVS